MSEILVATRPLVTKASQVTHGGLKAKAVYDLQVKLTRYLITTIMRKSLGLERHRFGDKFLFNISAQIFFQNIVRCSSHIYILVSFIFVLQNTLRIKYSDSKTRGYMLREIDQTPVQLVESCLYVFSISRLPWRIY